ncbi:MAG: ABC transporter ATP-binding protein [Candidatus Omnitrophica bacterium]|nr:ABC transporter ATP-binding protein [Candidatus Omnitrophota bacterium]
MSESVLKTQELSRQFGKEWAVRDLNLEIPKGSVFGLLGPNGAGKSTTIQMIMGLLPATKGTAYVLGMDPAQEGCAVRQRVGYVPEIYGFYEWMKVEQLIALVAAYHKTWNWKVCETLRGEFRLDNQQKVGELSKGMRAKLALLLALSFEPEMLILDEPTGGLDPAARRNFIETILAHYQESGKTILVSSHLLNEFSGLLDYVAFIREGKLELASRLYDLHQRMKRARLIFKESVPPILKARNVINVKMNGREAVVTCSDFNPDETPNELAQSTGAENVIVEEMSLEDIFVDLVGS